MSPSERLRKLRHLRVSREAGPGNERARKHDESNTMLAILMAGIAAVFILGIVVAFNYAGQDQPQFADTPPAQTTGSGLREPALATPQNTRP